MVTEEKVFLPTAEELRAAEIEQALEVGSITFFQFFAFFMIISDIQLFSMSL